LATDNSTARVRLLLWISLLAAACPYFVGLGDSSIWDANEAFYVETPREMMERGDYVIPTFNYELRLNKPVLSYWIVAGFYHLFGVSVAVQRIPIALGAMVLIAVAFWLAAAGAEPAGAEGDPGAAHTEAGEAGETAGLQHGGRGGRGGGGASHGASIGRGDAALWAAVGLAMTPRLLMFARRIFIDVYISMFMALTLLFFALAERFPGRRRLFLFAMYASIGLGVLTKGPVAAVVPGLVFAAYLAVHRELRRVRDMMIPLGTIVVLAIVVPWYAALYSRHGWTYILSFIFGENFARYAEGYGVESERGPFFYVPVLFSDAFPWSVFLFGAAAAFLAERRSGVPTAPASAARIRSLLWLWILVIVGFFSLSAAKQDLYIFPVVPAVAALGGITIARGLNRAGPAGAAARGTLAVRAGAGVAGFILAAAGAGVLYLFQSTQKVYALHGADLVGWAGIAGGSAAMAWAVLRRPAAALFALIASFVLIDWLFVLRVLPSFEVYKPVPGFARVLERRLTRDDVVATYDEAMPSLVYYLRRHVDQLFQEEEIVSRMRSGRTVYAAMSASNYGRLRDAFGVPTCVIDRRPTFDVKLKNVIARDPLPELVLVTNRCAARPD
jgi:4-amino-4-deoxy-L-arabinose transferase-like glycosyltransferase